MTIQKGKLLTYIDVIYPVRRIGTSFDKITTAIIIDDGKPFF